MESIYSRFDRISLLLSQAQLVQSLQDTSAEMLKFLALLQKSLYPTNLSKLSMLLQLRLTSHVKFATIRFCFQDQNCKIIVKNVKNGGKLNSKLNYCLLLYSSIVCCTTLLRRFLTCSKEPIYSILLTRRLCTGRTILATSVNINTPGC